MGIGDLVRNELRAECWPGWRKIWLDIIILGAQTRKRCQGNGIFIRRHMGFCNFPPEKDENKHLQHFWIATNLPQLHIRLYFQQVLEINAPWSPWGGLQHKATKLWVKMRRFISITGTTIRSFALWSFQVQPTSLYFHHWRILPSTMPRL